MEMACTADAQARARRGDRSCRSPAPQLPQPRQKVKPERPTDRCTGHSRMTSSGERRSASGGVSTRLCEECEAREKTAQLLTQLCLLRAPPSEDKCQQASCFYKYVAFSRQVHITTIDITYIDISVINPRLTAESRGSPLHVTSSGHGSPRPAQSDVVVIINININIDGRNLPKIDGQACS